ncbi:WSC domain-containing protein [Lachnellula occidentalis]|uniref:WSC domain-containing protein n=1 Tax=Lachnellula occidentalis TaxID=215460 RepID=A0A8H8UHD2_9HELO|nr:WSC domain-containing protein [Lachnellula occidentalis]
MKLSSLLACAVVFSGLGQAIPTWPSSIDELEDVMFLNTGYKSRGFSSHITPCEFSEFGAGRQTAAEWLRIGFHDMSTTNVFFTPHGGIDASIAFELDDGENIGAGFNTSLTTYSGFFNSRLPISDMIALGVYASVRGCGGPIIPMRGGRVDATAAGPAGVPQPQNGQGIFKNQFTRMGFNVTDMIQMTACGHTLGGVHAGDFNNIVTPGVSPNDFQLFDTTTSFDNDIAVQYINGSNSDALAVGPSVASGRNSDVAVFTADNNVTLKAMTNAATFNSMCTSILQRMIETVDPAVVLSDVIQPYEVKPSGIQLTLLSGGTQIQLSGDIRVRTTTRSVSSVAVVYKDRNGAGSTSITTLSSGTANGFDDSFSFYGFSSNLPTDSSISSFTVAVAYTTGATQTYDNNGNGFPIQDLVIVQSPQSCQRNGNLTVVAAVRGTTTAPSLTVEQKVARPSGTPIPSLVNATVAMVAGASFGPYTLYSTSYTINSTAGTKYGVSSGAFADTFKNAADLGTTCAPFGSTAPNSTSSSSSMASTTSSSSISKSSSATSTPTLAVKPTVGTYSFQGCYTEGTGVRALAGTSFYNYTDMSLEMCSSNCAGFAYWGVEYGGECYCGNSLDATSTLAAIGDCSFTCPGSDVEYCGAGNRLELYKLTSQVSSSSSSSGGGSSSSSASITSSILTTTSSTSSSTATTPTLHIVTSAGLYNYMGCFTEGNGVRALAAASYPGDSNTIEACTAACSPYMYAGAEYGRECYCADSFGAGSAIAPDGDCSMTCAGNQYEYCGAGNRLSVYVRNGTEQQ